jgi:hypothetical protein
MRTALFWVIMQGVVVIPYQITNIHYIITQKSTVFIKPKPNFVGHGDRAL